MRFSNLSFAGFGVRAVQWMLLSLWALLGPAVQAASADALFEPIAKVVTSPRCLNCHASGDFPTQGDQLTRHSQMVTRGDGHGLPTLRCTTCHQAANSADGRVPGAKEGWQMPPLSMSWQGKSAAQICAIMTDPSKNGGRKTPQETIDHMLVDDLVHWAWAPGGGRTVPPVPFNQFIDALKVWAKAGAPCPKN